MDWWTDLQLLDVELAVLLADSGVDFDELVATFDEEP